MNDTHPSIAAKMLELIAQKTPLERLSMGCSMFETSKYLVIRHILEKDPNISEGRLRREFFLKFYGEDFDPVRREKIANHLEQWQPK